MVGYCIYDILLINSTYDVVVNTQFHKLSLRRSRAFCTSVYSSRYRHRSLTPLDATRVNRAILNDEFHAKPFCALILFSLYVAGSLLQQQQQQQQHFRPPDFLEEHSSEHRVCATTACSQLELAAALFTSNRCSAASFAAQVFFIILETFAAQDDRLHRGRGSFRH